MQARKLLLKAADIEKMVGDRKVHFLNPNAVRINKSLGDAMGLNHIGVNIISVEPGKNTTEYHKHHYEEECVRAFWERHGALNNQPQHLGEVKVLRWKN